MKPETEIRNLKCSLRKAAEEARWAEIKAEQEAAEWKEMFDVLLRREAQGLATGLAKGLGGDS